MEAIHKKNKYWIEAVKIFNKSQGKWKKYWKSQGILSEEKSGNPASYVTSKFTSLCVNLIVSSLFLSTLSMVDLTFLGGLSLHLNHLYSGASERSYWQFGTLPIGIFLSNLDSGQLETSLMTSYCHFWNLSTFGDSRAVWVFWPKLGVFRKLKFSRWRSDGASMRLGGFR